MTNPINAYTAPSVSITTARTVAPAKVNELGKREMQVSRPPWPRL